MAAGETNLEFRVKVGGLNELGQLRSSILQLTGSTAKYKQAAMSLSDTFGKLEGAAQDIQKVFFGHATTLKQVVRNQKIFKNEIKDQTHLLQKARSETVIGSKSWRVYTAEIVKLRKQMSGIPLRKLGTDLRSVGNLALKKSKDLQWVGRQMVVGITAPIGIALRMAMQGFEAFEKQFVRTTKILGITGNEADDLRVKMKNLSTELGVSRSIVAGLTSDFAQMGKRMLGGGEADKLEDTALKYAELTLQLEHVGQVSAQVGRDFIANLAGIIDVGDDTANTIDYVRGTMAKFNLVENTTALSLKDLAEAFPQVSPAAKAAGINLVFLSGVIGGMRQAGLNATESAHALKFALQRMINPTAKVAALAENLGNSLGSDFHKDLGMGNMMLFKLSENLELIAEKASDEEALVYLGELVGKRQASRIYATSLALGSFAENVAEVGNMFRQVASKEGMSSFDAIADGITASVDDAQLKAQFENAFNNEEAIESFLRGQYAVQNSLELSSVGMLSSEQRAETMNVALSNLNAPMKAMVIDFMGATSAGKQFVAEFEAVMGGPAMMMQKVRTDVKNLLLEIGTVFFDTIRGMIPVIRKWIQKMQDMSPVIKQAIIVIAGFAAALGPVVFILAQMGVGFNTLFRGAASVLPKMKDLTRSMLLAKSMAGESLPVMRRFGTGWVQVSGKVKNAGKSIHDTFNALKQDSRIFQSGFREAQTASENVAQGMARSAANVAAIPMDKMHGPFIPTPGADATSQIKKSFKRQEKELRLARKATQNALQNSADDVDRWGNNVNRKFRGAANGVKKQTSRMGDFLKGFKRVTVQQQIPSRGVTNLTGLPAKGSGGQFMSGTKKSPSLDKMKNALMKPLMGITKGIGKVGEKAIDAGAVMQKGFMHPLKTIKAGMIATFKGSFKMIRLQSIASAMVFKLAWKSSLKAVKIAMMSTGILAIMVILGAVIMYIVQNIGKFKDAAGGAFDTFKQAWANIVGTFKEIGAMFFEIFEDIFGKKSKEGGEAVKDSMTGVASVIQGVATVVLWFSRVFRKVFLTILPPIIRGVLTVVSYVADGIGAALEWLADNWRTIAKVIIQVIYWIVKILEYLLDSVLIIVTGIIKVVQFLAKPFIWVVNEIIVPVLQVAMSALDKLLEVTIFVVQEIVKGFLWMGDKMEPIINNMVEGINGLGGILDNVTGGLLGWKVDFKLDGQLDELRTKADDFFDDVQAGRDKVNDWVQGDSFKISDELASSIDGGLQDLTDGITEVVGYDLGRSVRDALNGVVDDADFAAQLTDAIVEGTEDAVPEVEDAYKDALNKAATEAALAAADALRKVTVTWIGKVKTKFQQEMKKIADSAMKAFEAYSKVYLSAYDTRVQAIQDVISAEKELTKTIEYETARRDMLARMALDRENFIRNRALAIYEGRIEDARNITVKFRKSSDSSEGNVVKLDTSRGKHLLDLKRQNAINEIQEAKKHAAELIQIERDVLSDELALLQEKLPQNAAEWQQYVDDVNTKMSEGMARAFGPNAASAKSIEDFAQIVDDELRGKFADLFDDAGVIDKKVTNVGPVIKTQVDGWLTTFETFHTDAAGEMGRMFDEVETAWINDLNWEIIAFSWAEGRGKLSSAIVPLVAELELLKNGVTEAMDDMADDVEASVERVINAVGTLPSGDEPPTGSAPTGLAPGSYFGGPIPGSEPWRTGSHGWMGDGEIGGSATRGFIPPGQVPFDSAAVVDGWHDLAVVLKDTKTEQAPFDAAAVTQGWRDAVAALGYNTALSDSEKDREEGWSQTNPGEFTGGKRIEDTGNWDIVEGLRDIGSHVGSAAASAAGAVWDASWLSNPIDSAKSFGSGVASAASGIGGAYWDASWMSSLSGMFGKYNGGVVKAQYGKYLGGFQSSMVPVMAHGGEYVMSAKAVQNVGLSNLESMNHTRNYQGGGGGGTNIFVENFIGEPEWFEGMMGEYNVSVAPKNERSRGLESRKISSMADNNRRGRV